MNSAGRSIQKLAKLCLVMLMAYGPWLAIAQDTASKENQEQVQQQQKSAVRLTDAGNRIVYQLRYFDFENVRNLEQLLDQIPDLHLVLDDSMRGSDYVVLINKHVAGVAPRDLRDISRRFSLEDIKRIVIFRSPIAFERVGVSGPAINIVLKADADLSAGRWEVNTPLVDTKYKVPNIRLSYSDRDRPANWAYEVFADYLPNVAYRPRTRKEVYIDADSLQPTQRRLTEYDENNGYYALGGSVNWRFSDRFDMRVDSRMIERRKDRLQQRWVDDQENASLTGLEDDRRLFEVGLSSNFQLTPTSIWDTQFDLIGENRDKFVSTGQAGGDELIAASATRHEDHRLVFISSINTVANTGNESSLAVYARRRDRDALSAFSFKPISLKTDAEISEIRLGLIASYNWQTHPNVKAFVSLDIENWNLDQQIGPFSRDDSEIYFKPVVSLRWRFAPKTQLRVSSRRTIRQLNFDQLVFNFDLEDEIIDTGNLSMVPEKTWLNTAFVEQRVLGKKGRVSAGVFYRLLEDHIDREPRPGGSGPGNIGDAHVSGIQFTGRYEVQDNPVMLTVVRADFTFQKSEVTDPFTGLDRRVKGIPDKIAKLELRQEFPRTSFDYVLDMIWTSDRYYSDYNYREKRKAKQPIANLKANYQASDNIQLWLEIRGLFDLDESRLREKYAGDASLGQVSRYERSLFLEDRQFAIGLQGYF
jgi:hypothetical protein